MTPQAVSPDLASGVMHDNALNEGTAQADGRPKKANKQKSKKPNNPEGCKPRPSVKRSSATALEMKEPTTSRQAAQWKY